MEKSVSTPISGAGLAAPPHGLVMMCGFLAAYVSLDWLTYVYPGTSGVVPFNPEAALSIVLLMMYGVRAAPVVFLAAAAGELVVQQVQRPLATGLLCALILTMAFTGAALLLRTRWRIGVDLATRREVVRLMLATLCCMLLCALAYVTVVRSAGIGEWRTFLPAVRRFFTGYSAGIMIAMPLVLLGFSALRRAQATRYFVSREGWMQLATISACVIWVFFQDQRTQLLNVYLLFVPLVWAAARFGLTGAAIAMASIQAAMYAVLYFGGHKPQSMFELQLLMVVLAGTGLLLGVTIDEQRRASDEARESLRLAAAGEMAAALTHELNQPLTALSGYASAARLIASKQPAQGLGETLDKINAEASRAAAVIRRLRDFFRSGATRLERVPLPAFAQQVIGALQGKADSVRVAVTLRETGALPPVWVDAVQIEVVLRNLLLNAIESAAAAADQGERRVTVEITRAGASELMVSVSDSGGGVREADAERLFKSFASSKPTGMGMGLAISRAIVDAHGGRIWAVPGQGGRFCFTLPADTLQAQPARENG